LDNLGVAGQAKTLNTDGPTYKNSKSNFDSVS